VRLYLESLVALFLPRVRQAWQSPRRLEFAKLRISTSPLKSTTTHSSLKDPSSINTDKMVRYAPQHITPAKSARSRGSYLRVSFKNTRETAQAINGWKVQRAIKYLENVQELKECVPMRRYAGSTGRSAQGT
jgi:hypothetical protein